MSHHCYKQNSLYIDDVSCSEISRVVGTPVYCYSLSSIRRNYKKFSTNIPDSLICYAVKANPNVAIIKTIADLGGGADVVSKGEILLASAAGVSFNKIVFSGVGKTTDEIKYALDVGILQFNVESLEELRSIDEIAAYKKIVAPVSVRINPDIDAQTHSKVTTGTKANKFGISLEQLQDLVQENFSNIKFCGLSVHIGSQICDIKVFAHLTEQMKIIVKKLEAMGHTISRLDVGGGLGIAYHDDDKVPTIEEYAEVIRQGVCNMGYQIILEPGRAIVGNAGLLLTSVVYTKSNPLVKHVIVDAAMNDFMRPALYGSKHKILPVHIEIPAENEFVDVVGPVCETSDIFANSYLLQRVHSGDLLAICDVGAYGASLSSTYNSRRIIPEVIVCGNRFAVIKKRGTYEDIVNQYIVPNWIH